MRVRFLFLLFVAATPAYAQHAGMTMPMPTAHDSMMPGPLGVSMERMGSGTTWIPDAVTLPSYHAMLGNWSLMLHGFVFGQYDTQSGPRGDQQLGSLNWGMLMLSRDVAGGRLQARTMLSLDPLTVSNRGYPLLLQSGETYQGQPLHDRQHPHDFWMELGALYERPIASNLALSLYAAPSGEPALGPVAFMHRPSAMDDPTAPLGHHWQDATHISFGVLTAGLFTHNAKLEFSAFNGREPDEQRWDFDRIRLDSYSGRLTINPAPHWSFAAGYGWLKSPEARHPEESLHRMTASAMYGSRRGMNREWIATFIWGANKPADARMSYALLAETELLLDTRYTLLARAEYAQKSAQDLVIGAGNEDTRNNIAAFSLGGIRELHRQFGTTLGLGVRGTINFVPAGLGAYYASRTPTGLFIFARLRPYHLHPSMMEASMHGADAKPHSTRRSGIDEP